MSGHETIEDAEFSEVAETPAALVVREPQGSQALNLFGTDDPAAVIEKASRTATALADVITQRGLFKEINRKKYVFVEGWQLLGSILGVFPVLESCEPVEQNGVKGYRAIVAAQTRDGAIVGRASALCMRNESKWARADEYAVSSMAQTRAISKCLRAPLGFIMQLAGFAPTPEAEVPDEGFNDTPAAPPAPPAATPEERANSVTLARITKGLKLLEGKPGWAENEVVETAARTYKRPIKVLGDLTEKEAVQIIDAMKQYGEVEV